jgi:hypothetical protein
MRARRLAFLAALLGLVLTSLDCYGAWITSPEARRCCHSGHCSPSNPDPCCKIPPAGIHPAFVGRARVDVYPTIVVMAVVAPLVGTPWAAAPPRQIEISLGIPPPLEFRSDSLPLLI